MTKSNARKIAKLFIYSSQMFYDGMQIDEISDSENDKINQELKEIFIALKYGYSD